MRRGFSLLELSVALIIVSLLVGFGSTAGRNALEGSDRVTTQQRLTTIKKALDNYARLNGYLPCPAALNVALGSATFGVEQRTGTTCSSSSAPSAPSTPVTYVGAVPVHALGLPDAYVGDAWSNKILYVVSMSHVGSPTSYIDTDGPITVMYGDRSNSPYAVTTDRNGFPGAAATYVVVSHGPDGKGAYPMNGTAVGVACGSSANNDVQNCDGDAIFFDTAYNDGPNAATFFDDYVVWGSNASSRAPVASNNIANTDTCLSSGGTACDSDITTVGAAPDCDVTCSNAGYSSSGAQTTNCTYDSTCVAGNHARCTYQCCCTGTPPSGCESQTASWGGGHCNGEVRVLAHGASTTVENALAGYSGSETATCTDGELDYSGATCVADPPPSSSSSTSSGAATHGCSTGNCEEWCAPCQSERAGRPGCYVRNVCEKSLVSTNPCRAECLYARCCAGACSVCP